MHRALFLILLTVPHLSAAEPLQSGPQPGEKVPGPFEPFNVTGTNADEESCIYCKFGTDPSVMIFANQPGEPLIQLMKRLDGLNIKHKKAYLGTSVIFLNKDKALRTELKAIAKKHNFQEIILATMEQPPAKYAINHDADTTVLIYNGAVVKNNYALRAGELNDKLIDAIIADTDKLFAK